MIEREREIDRQIDRQTYVELSSLANRPTSRCVPSLACVHLSCFWSQALLAGIKSKPTLLSLELKSCDLPSNPSEANLLKSEFHLK